MSSGPPSGTVSFLFTDIESSTSLARRFPDSIQDVLARHHAILRTAIQSHGGTVFQIVGDAFCASFHTIGDAMQAAIDAQLALSREHWTPAAIKVRMGIHTGTAQLVMDPADSLGYAGYLTLTRAQRIMSAAHGGQILISNSSANLARQEIRGDLNLKDLGQHRLKSLPEAEHIWQVLAPGLESHFPSLASLSTNPNNLPSELNSFVGRDREIQEICALLETHRLVTLTGAGGIGKTRLSQQVAAKLLHDFQDGVWFVELASLSDPALVPNTVASIWGLREQQDRSLDATLLDWLADKALLLVLDNCEHLVQSCAKVADSVLQASHRSRLLATSLEALGVVGEQTYLVPTLQSPTPEEAHRIPLAEFARYPAVRLFAERARDSVPKFEVTVANAPAIAQICHRLDGIPLALELAAARVKMLQVEQVAERLDNRFRLLTGGGRTTLQRHQTLRSLIDWSYGLLTEREQILLRRLSAFAGGFTLRMAERVCGEGDIMSGDVLELLGHLVDKSLVVVGQAAGESRYRMLETIRQYARDRLQESDEATLVCNRHLTFILELAEEAEPKLHGAEQSLWFDRLEAERDNMRLALEWSRIGGQIGIGLRLVGVLFPFWELRGYWSEGYDAVMSVLKETKDTKGVLHAKALVAAGALASRCGYPAEMVAFFEKGLQVLRAAGQEGQRQLGFSLSQYAVALVDRDPAHGLSVAEESVQTSNEAGDNLGLAYGLFALGMIARRRADFAAARSAHEQSKRLFQNLGDQPMVALMLSNLAYTNYQEGNLLAGKEYFDESIRIAREIGDRYVEANSLPGRGDLARRLGNYDEAASFLQRGLAYHREIGGAHQGLISDLRYLGLLELNLGNSARARDYLKQAVIASRDGGLRYWLCFLFDALGYQASDENPERAARLFGAAETLREQLGVGLYPFEHEEYEKYTETAKSQLDEAAWRAAWNDGRAMTLDESTEYALQAG